MKQYSYDPIRILALITCCLAFAVLAACSSPAPAPTGTSQPEPRVVEVTKVVEATVAVTVEITPTPEPALTAAWPVSLPVQMGTIVPVPSEPISTTNIGRVVEVARWRKEGLRDAEVVRYSPDGKLLAIGTRSGIYLYDAQTMTPIKYIDTAERISSLAFSPDGSLLASGPMSMSNAVMTLRSVETGEVKHRFKVDTNIVFDIAFSPDGSLIAANSANDVQIWQVSDGQLIKTLKGGQYDTVIGVAFSPDGLSIAVGLAGGVLYTGGQTIIRQSAVQLWNVNGEKIRRTIKLPNDTSITSVAFSPDGSTLAGGVQVRDLENKAGTSSGLVLLWHVRDGALLHKLEGHTNSVADVDFSPNGSLLASGSRNDAEVRLWQVKDGSLLQVMKDNTAGLGTGNSVAFSPDGKTLASAGNSVKIWQVSDGSLLTKIGGQSSLGGQATFSPDSSRIAVTGGVIQVNDGTLITTTGVSAFSPDGSMEIVAEQVRRSSDGVILFTLPYTSIIAITFSPDGSRLAAASALLDRIDVWQTHNWDLVHSVEFSTPTMVRGLSFSPNEPWLAAGLVSAERIINNGSLILSPIQSARGSVQIWNVQDHQLVATLPEDQSAPLVAFSPDGSTLASDVGVVGDLSTVVQLWNTVDWSPGKKLTWRGILSVGPAGSMAFSPDGSILATGSTDGTIRLWQVPDGKLLREFKAHNDVGVEDLQFSADGLWLASSSHGDDTVRLWGVKP